MKLSQEQWDTLNDWIDIGIFSFFFAVFSWLILVAFWA